MENGKIDLAVHERQYMVNLFVRLAEPNYNIRRWIELFRLGHTYLPRMDVELLILEMIALNQQWNTNRRIRQHYAKV